MHKSKSVRVAAVLAAAFVVVSEWSSAQEAPTGRGGPERSRAASATLEQASRSAAVEAAAQRLRERYIFPDVGEKAALTIESALADGSYDSLDQQADFAERLEADLFAVARDKHLRVRVPDIAQRASNRPPNEGGVTRADILDGNVGYIEMVGFPEPGWFDGPVARAMAALQDTRALILDCRRNLGGDPESVAHLVSYFVEGDKPVHVNTVVRRNPGTDTFRTQEFWSVATPFSYVGKPVYVLTSSSTFSGGEEFTYDMQAMDLAEIVGETTAGGANPTSRGPIGAGLEMSVPYGRAENPITGTNWEGVGVAPDIAVASDQAFKTALEQLDVSPAGTGIDTLSKSRVFEPRTTPQPGADAAIQRFSQELARGEPNYDLLSPQLGQLARDQLPALRDRYSSLGAVESMKFVVIDYSRGGANLYDVQYENGALRIWIVLTPDGKIDWGTSQLLRGQP